LASSADEPELDHEAPAMLTRAQPVPQPPAHTSSRELFSWRRSDSISGNRAPILL
jgi:hypothetical protein